MTEMIPETSPADTSSPGNFPYNATAAAPTNTNGSVRLEEESCAKAGIAALNFVQAFLTTTGNIIVLFVVCRSGLHRRMPSAGPAINIAVSDMVLAAALFLHAFLLMGGSEQLSRRYRTWCIIYALFMIFSSLAVQLSLLLIVAERYITISHPFLYPKVIRTRNVLLAVASMWAYSLLLAMLSLHPNFSHANVVNDFCLAGDVLNKEYILLFVAHFLVLTLISLVANTSVTIIACHQNARVHQEADSSIRSSLPGTSTSQPCPPPRLVKGSPGNSPLRQDSSRMVDSVGVACSIRLFPSESQEADDSVFLPSQDEEGCDTDLVGEAKSLKSHPHHRRREGTDPGLVGTDISSCQSGMGGVTSSAPHRPRGCLPFRASSYPTTSHHPECPDPHEDRRQRTFSLCSVTSEFSSVTYRSEEPVIVFQKGDRPDLSKETSIRIATTTSSASMSNVSQHRFTWYDPRDSAIHENLPRNKAAPHTPAPSPVSSHYQQARKRAFSFEQNKTQREQSSLNDTAISPDPHPLLFPASTSNANTLKTASEIPGPSCLDANLLQVPTSTPGRRHQRLSRRFNSSFDFAHRSASQLSSEAVQESTTMTTAAVAHVSQTSSHGLTAAHGRDSIQTSVRRTFVLLKHSGLLALLFSLSWFPFVIVELLELAGYPQTLQARKVASMFIFITPVSNPVIYVWGNVSFRQAFNKVMHRKRRVRVAPAGATQRMTDKINTHTDSYM